MSCETPTPQCSNAFPLAVADQPERPLREQAMESVRDHLVYFENEVARHQKTLAAIEQMSDEEFAKASVAFGYPT